MLNGSCPDRSHHAWEAEIMTATTPANLNRLADGLMKTHDRPLVVPLAVLGIRAPHQFTSGRPLEPLYHQLTIVKLADI
jgi:hypothetical protein